MSRFQRQTPQDSHAKPAASILGCSATHRHIPDISQQHLSPSERPPRVTLGRGLCGNLGLHSLTEATLGKTYSTECYQCQIIIEFNKMAGTSEHPDYHIAIAHMGVCPHTHTSTKSCPACTFPSAPTLASQGGQEIRESLSKLWLSAHKPS